LVYSRSGASEIDIGECFIQEHRAAVTDRSCFLPRSAEALPAPTLSPAATHFDDGVVAAAMPVRAKVAAAFA
jgi:hypothetical protein